MIHGTHVKGVHMFFNQTDHSMTIIYMFGLCWFVYDILLLESGRLCKKRVRSSSI